MSAIVTPAGVRLDVPATSEVAESTTKKEDGPFPPPEDPHTRKLKRLEKMLQWCVPNEDVRVDLMHAAEASRLPLRRTQSDSNLAVRTDQATRRRQSTSVLRWELWSANRDDEETERMLVPHRDVVPKELLPFPQRPYVYSKHATGMCGGALDSMMLPALVSCASVCATTYAMIWNLTAELASFLDFDDSNVRNFMARNIGSSVSVASLIYMSMFIFSGLLETPPRVLLFYRLWEHRIVINFKERTLMHRATRLKVFGVALVALYYVVFGSFVLKVAQGFYIVFLQSFATLSWIVYSNINPDRQLFFITAAVRQQKHVLASESGDIAAAKATLAPQTKGDTSIMPRLGKCCDDLVVEDEVAVKYDVFALDKYITELYKRKAKFTPKTPECEQQYLYEGHIWVSLLLTWVGRLGNTKALLGTKVARSDHGDHGSDFFRLYRDDIWHACGSFAKEPNAVEASKSWNSWIRRSGAVHIGICLAVFAYQLVRSIVVSQ